jgi:galactose mutarotase-like enzyme
MATPNDGRFTWDGQEYQLPLNDPAKKNAIHGFACRHPWRVLGRGADGARHSFSPSPRCGGGGRGVGGRLVGRGAVEGGGGAALRLLCSEAFREMVVFTPPHRQAFGIEPYTCTTDAINLQQRGVDAGWRVLPPGGRWSAVVELRVGPAGSASAP